jgi:hypothetical protein
MPTFRIVSPERRWRAGSLVLLAGWLVWRASRYTGPWREGGLVATRRDGAEVDLLSTKAYSRVPFSRHLDELQRICWTLEECLATRQENPPPDP